MPLSLSDTGRILVRVLEYDGQLAMLVGKIVPAIFMIGVIYIDQLNVFAEVYDSLNNTITFAEPELQNVVVVYRPTLLIYKTGLFAFHS